MKNKKSLVLILVTFLLASCGLKDRYFNGDEEGSLSESTRTRLYRGTRIFNVVVLLFFGLAFTGINFSALLSITGSLASVFLAFCFPVMIYIKH